jgi:hypothetical protein
VKKIPALDGMCPVPSSRAAAGGGAAAAAPRRIHAA